MIFICYEKDLCRVVPPPKYVDALRYITLSCGKVVDPIIGPILSLLNLILKIYEFYKKAHYSTTTYNIIRGHARMSFFYHKLLITPASFVGVHVQMMMIPKGQWTSIFVIKEKKIVVITTLFSDQAIINDNQHGI